MYHPADGQGEWVELVNLHGVNIDVSNWEIEGAISYQFPVGSVIPGNGYIVLASAEGQFPDALGLFQGRLDDDGERLRLVNNSGRIMSELSYNDRGEWPVAPDGAGVSLAKRRPQDRASDSASWARSETIGGTPGTANVVREEASSGLLLN
ncbi:lamin tail domain-containing protein, partial [bacterium]|nr:lamin tail domain-containing protein [bacterium]